MSEADKPARVGVVMFPGSNDDRDLARGFALCGARVEVIWHKDTRLPELDGIGIPGGFSYGDYLRCGAMARFSPVMRSVVQLAALGRPVLGVCNGFQILCEAGLLPGALRTNRGLRFACRDVAVRVEHVAPPFTSQCEPGQRLVIPVKHGEGCYTVDGDLLAEIEASGQVVLRYEPGENPNGAMDDIAGVANPAGNVMGLMPHPEHAVDPLLGSSDGGLILGSLIDAARERMLSAVG